MAAFRHTPAYDEATGRLTIHLTSLKAQSVQVAGRRFDFAEGERLHVEDSNKYAVEDFRALARSAGYVAETAWVDPRELVQRPCAAGGVKRRNFTFQRFPAILSGGTEEGPSQHSPAPSIGPD